METFAAVLAITIFSIGVNSDAAGSCSGTVYQESLFRGTVIDGIPGFLTQCCKYCLQKAECVGYYHLSIPTFGGGICYSMKHITYVKGDQGRRYTAQRLGRREIYDGQCGPILVDRAIMFNPMIQLAGRKDQCCALCDETVDCKAFTWTDYDGGTCFLRSKAGRVYYNKGAVSGILWRYMEKYTTMKPTTTAKPNVGPKPNELIIDKEIIDDTLGPTREKVTQKECKELCMKMYRCMAYSWVDYKGGNCDLKSKFEPMRIARGIVSEILSKPVPTPPAKPNVGPKPNELIIDKEIIDDTLGPTRKKVTQKECKELCMKMYRCMAYSWIDYKGGNCDLKSKVEPMRITRGFVSEILSKPVPTPPATKCGTALTNKKLNGWLLKQTKTTWKGCCKECTENTACEAYTWGSATETGKQRHCTLRYAVGSKSDAMGADTVVLDRATSSSKTPSECTDLLQNKYIDGHDLWQEKGKLWECCAMCEEQRICKAFTWSDYNGGTCMLKTETGPLVRRDNSYTQLLSKSEPQEAKCVKSISQSNKVKPSKVLKKLEEPYRKLYNECCTACSLLNGCEAIAWSEKTCYLKSAPEKFVGEDKSLTAAYLKLKPEPNKVEPDKKKGKNIPGNALDDSKADSIEACFKECEKNKNCVAISFKAKAAPEKRCFLKNSKSGMNVDDEFETWILGEKLQCGTVHRGKKMEGFPIDSIYSLSFDACCKQCKKRPGCRAVIFQNWQGECHLMSKILSTKENVKWDTLFITGGDYDERENCAIGDSKKDLYIDNEYNLGKKTIVMSKEQCCKKCKKNPKCWAFTSYVQSKTVECQLKSTKKEKYLKAYPPGRGVSTTFMN